MKHALPAAALMLLAPLVAHAQTTDVPAAAATGHYTLNTPIKDLVADPQAKAVLDKDLPGLSTDDNLSKFEDKSLREFQPLTGGQLTDDLLKKTGEDLAAIGGGDGATPDSTAAPADDSSAPDAAPDTATAPGDDAAAKPADDGSTATSSDDSTGR